MTSHINRDDLLHFYKSNNQYKFIMCIQTDGRHRSKWNIGSHYEGINTGTGQYIKTVHINRNRCFWIILQDVEQPLRSIPLTALSSWLAQRKAIFTNVAQPMPPFTSLHMKHITCLCIKWITISSILIYSFHAVQIGE